MLRSAAKQHNQAQLRIGICTAIATAAPAAATTAKVVHVVEWYICNMVVDGCQHHHWAMEQDMSGMLSSISCHWRQTRLLP
jgi:hypothetical protein